MSTRKKCLSIYLLLIKVEKIRGSIRYWVVNYSFLVGVLFILGAAVYDPEWGTSHGPLKTHLTSRIAVALIFLSQGLIIDTRVFAMGLRRWKLHTYIQLMIFGIIPLCMFAFLSVFGGSWREELKLGLMFLALLPSTISSSVVLTERAGGNVPVCIFNATLSNVLGVFLVPLGIYLYARHDLELANKGHAILRLILNIILPLIVGQWVRIKYMPNLNLVGKLRIFSRGLVLFVIYSAFCNSIKFGHWNEYSWLYILKSVAISGIALIGISFMVIAINRIIGAKYGGIGYEERVAVFFCSAQKTVVLGVPLIQELLSRSNFEIGLIILPLMVYHGLQLYFGASISLRRVL